MCAPTKQNAGFWLKSSKSHQVLHILLYGQAQLLFFPIGEAPFLLGGFCMPVPMARSSAKRLAFFVTNINMGPEHVPQHRPTDIPLHSNQHFPSPICMTVPMARSFWLLATLHLFDFFSGFCILWFARFWPIYKNTHFYRRKALGCVKTLIFIDENKCQLKNPK